MSLSRIAIAALVAASGCAYAAEDNKLVIENETFVSIRAIQDSELVLVVTAC